MFRYLLDDPLIEGHIELKIGLIFSFQAKVEYGCKVCGGDNGWLYPMELFLPTKLGGSGFGPRAGLVQKNQAITF